MSGVNLRMPNYFKLGNFFFYQVNTYYCAIYLLSFFWLVEKEKGNIIDGESKLITY